MFGKEPIIHWRNRGSSSLREQTLITRTAKSKGGMATDSIEREEENFIACGQTEIEFSAYATKLADPPKKKPPKKGEVVEEDPPRPVPEVLANGILVVNVNEVMSDSHPERAKGPIETVLQVILSSVGSEQGSVAIGKPALSLTIALSGTDNEGDDEMFDMLDSVRLGLNALLTSAMHAARDKDIDKMAFSSCAKTSVSQMLMMVDLNEYRHDNVFDVELAKPQPPPWWVETWLCGNEPTPAAIDAHARGTLTMSVRPRQAVLDDMRHRMQYASPGSGTGTARGSPMVTNRTQMTSRTQMTDRTGHATNRTRPGTARISTPGKSPKSAPRTPSRPASAHPAGGLKPMSTPSPMRTPPPPRPQSAMAGRRLSSSDSPSVSAPPRPATAMGGASGLGGTAHGNAAKRTITHASLETIESPEVVGVLLEYGPALRLAFARYGGGSEIDRKVLSHGSDPASKVPLSVALATQTKMERGGVSIMAGELGFVPDLMTTAELNDVVVHFLPDTGSTVSYTEFVWLLCRLALLAYSREQADTRFPMPEDVIRHFLKHVHDIMVETQGEVKVASPTKPSPSHGSHQRNANNRSLAQKLRTSSFNAPPEERLNRVTKETKRMTLRMQAAERKNQMQQRLLTAKIAEVEDLREKLSHKKEKGTVRIAP